MSLIKVLGLGSPFGDDQAGWRVASGLLAQAMPAHLIIESHDRPGARLIELMSNVSLVFLIDAVKTGHELGFIHRFKNKEIDDFYPLMSTHDMGVAQALQLGRALDALPKTVILYGIEVDSIALDNVLSKPVQRAIDEVVARLTKELRGLF